ANNVNIENLTACNFLGGAGDAGNEVWWNGGGGAGPMGLHGSTGGALHTNPQIDGDAPAPQNGACPHNGTSPITHTHSCWVFIHNSVHDNNNPDVPQAGSASAGPTGTGMTVSGGSND